MSQTGPRTTNLKEMWRDRLKTAKLRLEFAASFRKEVEQDCRSGTVATPDGDFALRKALVAESVAREEYVTVLDMFAKLGIEGEGPDNRDPHTGAAR